jgi:nucleotide-binding universal stress UspA family protein
VVKKRGVNIISKIVKSDLESKSIIEYAKKENVDVIIMSKSHLSTHAERVYYNSTVEAVFKKTPCMFLYLP